MLKRKESNFIPSPYPVVTSYERAFVKVFNDNLAAALQDVFKYIARAAATTIKEGIDINSLITQPTAIPTKGERKEKAENTDIEKAKHVVGDVKIIGGKTHVWTEYKPGKYDWRVKERAKPKRKVGDIHPNGKWVWTEYADGKFDWKSLKGWKHGKKDSDYKWGDVLPEIDELKTSKAIQDHLIDKRILTKYNAFDKHSLDKADLNSVRQIASTLLKLHEKLPFQPITIEVNNNMGKNATMDAWIGHRVRIKEKLFTNFNSAKYHKMVNEDYRKGYEENIKVLDENIKHFEINKQYVINKPSNDPAWDKKRIAQADKYIKKFTKDKEKMQKALEINPCWVVGEKDTMASDLILHEMGHILNAQCTGSCGKWKMSSYKDVVTSTEQTLHIQLNKERDELFERYKKEKHISEYSSTKNVEFFAECFVYYIKGDKRLPSYIREYYDKYFKLAPPKF